MTRAPGADADAASAADTRPMPSRRFEDPTEFLERARAARAATLRAIRFFRFASAEGAVEDR